MHDSNETQETATNSNQIIVYVI